MTGNLDDVVVARDELPFSVDILPLSSPALRQRLLRAAVVMGQSHHEIADVASFWIERFRAGQIAPLDLDVKPGMQRQKA